MESRERIKVGNRNGLLNAYIFNCPLDSLDEMGGSKQTSRLVAPRKEQSGQSYRSNRFGFRQTNLVRPITTGLQPKVSDFKDPNNNNPIGKYCNRKQIATKKCRGYKKWKLINYLPPSRPQTSLEECLGQDHNGSFEQQQQQHGTHKYSAKYHRRY